jgi:Integrase core domain
VLPFFEEHGIALCRVLSTKTKSPQTNGICERFHRTVLDEFYRVAFRKRIYRTIDELQSDLDAWVKQYNETRPHQGRWCYGKTPMQTEGRAAVSAPSRRGPGGARNRGGRRGSSPWPANSRGPFRAISAPAGYQPSCAALPKQ